MKNKAFTLVELLAVIVILAIIIIIAVPKTLDVIESTRQKAFESSEKLMVKAAEQYVEIVGFNLPTVIGESETLSYELLKSSKYISKIYNPETKDECTSGGVIIKLIATNRYSYTPNLSCGTYSSSGPTIPPVILLVGDDPYEVEVNSTYVDPGATANDATDGDLTGNIVVDESNLVMSEKGIYTVTYNVTDSDSNSAIEIIRTVNVIYPIDYANRMKLTIDSSLIDSNLTQFPLTVHLNAANGTDAIFTELGENNKRIVFTKADGVTEIYAEIEEWDNINKTAAIHISKDDLIINSSSNTEIYMYYDNTKADNVTYVGDTASAVGQNVWDNNYIMVNHMGSNTENSAADNLDLIEYNTSVINGEIGNARDFNGSNAYLNIPGLTTTSNITVSLSGKTDIIKTWARFYDFSTIATNSAVGGIIFTPYSATEIYFEPFNAAGIGGLASNNFSTGIYNYWTTKINSTSSSLHKDSLILDSRSLTAAYAGATMHSSYIGKSHYTLDAYFDGQIDEFRISNIGRSDDWIKAEYDSLFDNLITYTIE